MMSRRDAIRSYRRQYRRAFRCPLVGERLPPLRELGRRGERCLAVFGGIDNLPTKERSKIQACVHEERWRSSKTTMTTTLGFEEVGRG